MRKWLLGLIIVSGLGVTQAQTYLGIGATLVDFSLPLPNVQIGGKVAQNVEVRGTLDSTLAFNVLGLDALYPFAVSGTPLEVYVGGGPDLVWIFSGGEPFLGVHVTVGLEYLLGVDVSGIGNLGLYGELQPLFPLLGTEGLTSLVKARAGVNFCF